MEHTLEIKYALDTLYFLLCGALVMWMAAGFAMLESGLVRSKNTTEILVKNIALYAISCLMFTVVGYQIMYPSDTLNAFIPKLAFLLGSENISQEVLSNPNIDTWYDGAYYSSRADFFFQVVFVATAMSIVSGAIAERMKLWPFLLFTVIMTGFIYPLQGYWKWGGGFLDAQGFADFAGSGVVHLCGATAALTGAIIVGPRKGKYLKSGRSIAMPGANLPMATLGTFILWLGWLGFNGGSQLIISNFNDANIVSQIFVNTNAAACGGVISTLIISKLYFKKTDLTMILNGAIAGLVAITAEPSTPSVLLATFIGAIGGCLVFVSVIFIDKMKVDDPVGAISAHGVVGIWGLLAVPLSNDSSSFIIQLLGIGSIFSFTFITSFIVWKLIDKVFTLRVNQVEEYEGIDVHECGLHAYPEFTNK